MIIEPSADARVAAATIRQLYLALLNEGFTEEQAMTLVKSMIELSTP